MDENIEENGKIQICMELGHTNGLMGEYLQVNMITIKSTDTVSTHGLMIVNTEAGGRKESKTVLASTLSMKRQMN